MQGFNSEGLHQWAVNVSHDSRLTEPGSQSGDVASFRALRTNAVRRLDPTEDRHYG